MKQKANCKKCRKPFEYEWIGRPRRVCDPCKAEVLREAVARCRSGGRGERSPARKTPHAKTLDSRKVVLQDDGVARLRRSLGVLDAIAAMTRDQVATALGTSYESVRSGEERGLLKLRKHPELMRLWLQYRENGGGAPAREDAGERLLDYLLHIAKWYRLAERLRENGCEEEWLECIELIKKFQHKLGEALKESEPAI